MQNPYPVPTYDPQYPSYSGFISSNQDNQSELNYDNDIRSLVQRYSNAYGSENDQGDKNLRQFRGSTDQGSQYNRSQQRSVQRNTASSQKPQTSHNRGNQQFGRNRQSPYEDRGRQNRDDTRNYNSDYDADGSWQSDENSNSNIGKQIDRGYDTGRKRERDMNSERSAPKRFRSHETGEKGGSVTVWLGNLGPETTEDDILDTFGMCGKIKQVRLKRYPETGRLKGFGFLEFESSKGAQNALRLQNVYLHGRTVRVELSKSSAEEQGELFAQTLNQISSNSDNFLNNTYQQNSSDSVSDAPPLKVQQFRVQVPQSQKPPGCRTVFVGNLSDTIDDDTIFRVFSEAGDIKAIRWLNDRTTGKFKGCGYIEFWAEESTVAAVAMNGRVVLGRQMRVDYASNQPNEQNDDSTDISATIGGNNFSNNTLSSLNLGCLSALGALGSLGLGGLNNVTGLGLGGIGGLTTNLGGLGGLNNVAGLGISGLGGDAGLNSGLGAGLNALSGGLDSGLTGAIGSVIGNNVPSGGNVSSSGSSGRGRRPSREVQPQSQRPPGCVTLFIGNIPNSVNDETIHKIFGHCGPIQQIRWLNDKNTGRFKGCGFIDFYNEESAIEGAKLNGTLINGNVMRVDFATKPKDANTGGSDRTGPRSRGQHSSGSSQQKSGYQQSTQQNFGSSPLSPITPMMGLPLSQLNIPTLSQQQQSVLKSGSRSDTVNIQSKTGSQTTTSSQLQIPTQLSPNSQINNSSSGLNEPSISANTSNPDSRLFSGSGIPGLTLLGGLNPDLSIAINTYLNQTLGIGQGNNKVLTQGLSIPQNMGKGIPNLNNFGSY